MYRDIRRRRFTYHTTDGARATVLVLSCRQCMNVGWLLLLTFTLHGVWVVRSKIMCNASTYGWCQCFANIAHANAKDNVSVGDVRNPKMIGCGWSKKDIQKILCVLISFAQDPKNEWLWLEEYTKFFHESSNCRRTLIEKFSLFLGTSSKDTILKERPPIAKRLAIKIETVQREQNENRSGNIVWQFTLRNLVPKRHIQKYTPIPQCTISLTFVMYRPQTKI